MSQLDRDDIIMGMATASIARVIVHPAAGGQWTWTQVARNGSPAAIAPLTYDDKHNARRAGQRQVEVLCHGYLACGGVVTGTLLPPDAPMLIVNEHYRRP